MQGVSGHEAGVLTTHLYEGQIRDEAIFIDPSAVDQTNTPKYSLPFTTISNGLLRTSFSEFVFGLPMITENILVNVPLYLEYVTLEGDVSIDETRFSLTQGVLSAYLDRNSIFRFLEGLYEVCERGDTVVSSPDWCSDLNLTGDPENDLVFFQALTNYDTHLRSTGPRACSEEYPCNATSVCILIEMSSVEISGIAPN